MGEGEFAKGASLALTPTWAVVSVIVVMVSLGFFFQGSLKQLAKWLNKTKRKALLAALEKIKEELMVFGVLSLLMGHWIVVVAKICVKSSALNSRFYPCAVKKNGLKSAEHALVSTSKYTNNSLVQELVHSLQDEHCPQGHESFVSHESLEELHRLMFVLGVTHVSYSFITIALSLIKIYSWRTWENQAKTIAFQSQLGSPEAAFHERRRLSTFVLHHTSHPWSKNGVLVWLLCFSRQFWSSMSQYDYMALRLGFITKHQLPLTYDFHNYMLRSMEEEFRDIVGIGVPLWIYGICCIFLEFHGTHLYFWLSFLPAILILLMGTKLHRVVVKLAFEIMDSGPWSGNYHFNLRDELFWFGKPRLLLWLIQFISFQNAFEMSTFLWSLWEIKDSSCFMDSKKYVAIRLIFGVVTQVWFSFITFPLYIIITQMGAKFKKTVVSENVRKSLHGWQRRVKARQSSSAPNLLAISAATSLDSSLISSGHGHQISDSASSSIQRSSSAVFDKLASFQHQESSTSLATNSEIAEDLNEKVPVSCVSGPPRYDSSSDEDDR